MLFVFRKLSIVVVVVVVVFVFVVFVVTSWLLAVLLDIRCRSRVPFPQFMVPRMFRSNLFFGPCFMKAVFTEPSNTATFFGTSA